MDEISALLEKANKSIEVADHLAYVTYPMVKEPKLGFTIAEHTLSACLNATDALLAYERMFKRIDYYPNSFVSKIDIMKRDIGPRYNIERKHIFIMEDLNTILSHRKKANLEFIRRDKLVICDHDFDIRTLTMEKVKSYVYESKNFLIRINTILKSKNDRRH